MTYHEKHFTKRRSVGRPKKRQWYESKYTYDPEKRTKLLPHEILEGPEPLTVIWDGGKRFKKDVGEIFARAKKLRNPTNRRIAWEIILEGEYQWFRRTAKHSFCKKDKLDRIKEWRRKWSLRKRRFLSILRKTSYAYLPPSKIFSTMPT